MAQDNAKKTGIAWFAIWSRLQYCWCHQHTSARLMVEDFRDLFKSPLCNAIVLAVGLITADMRISRNLRILYGSVGVNTKEMAKSALLSQGLIYSWYAL